MIFVYNVLGAIYHWLYVTELLLILSVALDIIPIYNISLIINVKGFANTYLTVNIKLLEMPSIPLIDLFLNGQSPV